MESEEKKGETGLSKTPSDGVTISRWQSKVTVSPRSDSLTLTYLER
jgi:hypothetical protein